jgi:hypothetical protein
MARITLEAIEQTQRLDIDVCRHNTNVLVTIRRAGAVQLHLSLDALEVPRTRERPGEAGSGTDCIARGFGNQHRARRCHRRDRLARLPGRRTSRWRDGPPFRTRPRFAAVAKISRQIHRWRLHRRIGHTFAEIARLIKPGGAWLDAVLRGVLLLHAVPASVPHQLLSDAVGETPSGHPGRTAKPQRGVSISSSRMARARSCVRPCSDAPSSRRPVG